MYVETFVACYWTKEKISDFAVGKCGRPEHLKTKTFVSLLFIRLKAVAVRF